MRAFAPQQTQDDRFASHSIQEAKRCKDAPYDAIVVTAAPREIPTALVEQLAPQGRLVIPVGEWHQDIQVITRTPEGFSLETTIPVQFVPMVTGVSRSPDASRKRSEENEE